MDEFEIEIGEGKKRVKIVKDRYSLGLLVMTNGFQWSGATIGDYSQLDMIIEAIEKYKTRSTNETA